MKTTLLLNADAQPMDFLPVSVLTWDEAITLVYKEAVSVIWYHDLWYVRSPNESIQLPSVVILKEFVNVNKAINFSRYNVFLRDEFTCQYTGKTMFSDRSHLTLDHIVPQSKGGQDTWDNLVTSCFHINSKKGNDSKIVPKHRPHKPDFWELVNKRKKFPLTIPDYRWNEFLDWPEDKLVKETLKNPFSSRQ